MASDLTLYTQRIACCFYLKVASTLRHYHTASEQILHRFIVAHDPLNVSVKPLLCRYTTKINIITTINDDMFKQYPLCPTVSLSKWM